jgi:hypothetical protein
MTGKAYQVPEKKKNLLRQHGLRQSRTVNIILEEILGKKTARGKARYSHQCLTVL